MGFASPDLDTWKRFTEELQDNESLAYETIWGCEPSKKATGSAPGSEPKTATQIVYDKQPQINKLNQYADACEWFEWKLTEWIANALDALKPKDESISLIVYGRRYIIEGVDTLQEKYQDARECGISVGILDALYQEPITVKFKNDPEWLRIELIKACVEPYLHSTSAEIFERYGWKEAMKKDFFQQWWSDMEPNDLQGIDVEEKLEAKFATDFKAYILTVDYVPPSGGKAIPPTEPPAGEEDPVDNT